MKRTEKSSNIDLEMLQFLWDKWKHHDNLIYSRERTFWVIQGVLGGIIAISIQRDINYFWKLISCAVILLFLGGLGLLILKMIETDRNCRNAFNCKIVQILKERTDLLANNGADWNEKFDWKESKDNHPINLWHTPSPFLEGEGVRASGIVKKIIKTIVLIELLIGLILLLYALLFL